MKKLLSFVVVLVLLATTVPSKAALPEEIDIFRNVDWTIDSEGTLTIEEGPVNYVINTSWTYYGPWQNNTSIKKIIFPDNVKFIGERMFEGCENIEEIVLPEALEELEEDVFLGCNNIGKITISSKNKNFKTVDGVLFDYSGQLLIMGGGGRKGEEYTVPYGTVEIAEGAFKNNTNLKRVNFPESLATIKDEAFKGCVNIESIILPDTVTYLGQDAFEDCEKLDSIKMPPYVYLQNNPFYNTAFYNNKANWDEYGLYINKHLIAIEQNATVKPDTVSIAGEAFANRSDIERVMIPASVKCIGDKAFANSDKLTEVIFEEGLEILGHKAFHYSKIKSVTLPESLLIIGGEAFMSSDIEAIVIPDNVIDLGDRAFECCYDLKTVTLGEKLGHIGHGAFRTCHQLESVTIPDSVWSISDYAFFYCSNLKEIKIGKGLYEFDGSIFSSCNLLSVIEIDEGNPYLSSRDNVVFDKNGEKLIYYPKGKKDANYIVPDGVRVIGEYSLNNTAFKSITIPDSVKVIESNNYSAAFTDVYYMGTRSDWDKITIKRGNHTFENAIVHFSDGGTKNIYNNLKYREEADCVYITGLADSTATEISIPGEIEGKNVVIENRAFSGKGIVTVNLDERIKIIPPEAFSGCTKLENINLENIEHIASKAFYGCVSLKEINLLNIKTWDGIEEGRLNTSTMKMRLIPYMYMIGYDASSIYTVFYGAKIENLKIKWPEENFSQGAETFPALFLNCDIKNVVFENFTVSPSLAEFCGIDPSRRNKSVDPYVNLVKPGEELVIYGKSDAVKNYAETIGVKYTGLE